MRAIVIAKHGDPGVLRVEERPDPPITPGHVRIEVAAAGVNFADTMARAGLYPDAPKLPMVVGYEVAGTVAEVGADVDGVEVGARVMAGTRFGGYASQVVVPGADVIPLPDALTLRAGRGDPRQLLDGMDRAARLRQPASGRARADPRGRRRRRDRRDADREATRRGGPRHRLARQARGDPRLRRRRRPRLHAPRLGRGLGDLRPRPRRRRRRVLQALLPAAAPGRPARRVRRVEPSAGRAAPCCTRRRRRCGCGAAST